MMLSSYLTGIVGVILIACGWLAVQRLWQRHFPEHAAGGEEDALAGRSGCHGCNCGPSQCERKTARPQQHPEEVS